MSGWDYWRGTFEAASTQASKLAEVVSAQVRYVRQAEVRACLHLRRHLCSVKTHV